MRNSRKVIPESRKKTAKTGARRKATKTRRRPGRPKRREAPVTPELLLKIGNYWLKRVPVAEIARRVGVDAKAVRHHLDNNIIPGWHREMGSKLKEDMALVALIERTAWERFESAEPGETREQIEKALLEGGRKPRLVKQAVSKVTRTGQVAWIQVIQWCLEFRARIYGYYAPTQHRVDTGGELRVIGKTVSEVDQEMLKLLHEKIEERRRYEQGLEPGAN